MKIVLLLLFVSGSILHGGEFSDIPKLIVKGEASLFKPADQMEMTIGVVSKGDTSSAALQENQQAVHQVIENLRAIGLPDSDHQTGNFIIHPIYIKSNKDTDESSQGTFSHYEVVNTIKIKTLKMDLAEKIITTSVQAGANQIDQVNFNLSNPQAYREAAIQAAAQNALADANTLATLMGVRIKRILNLSLDRWLQHPSPMMLGRSQTAIEPGESEIHAIVNVIFEIEQ